MCCPVVLVVLAAGVVYRLKGLDAPGPASESAVLTDTKVNSREPYVERESVSGNINMRSTASNVTSERETRSPLII